MVISLVGTFINLGGNVKILKEETGFEGEFVGVKKVYFLGRDNQVGIWEEVKRKTYGKIVSIFALTKA
jgi:hypothetical protein